MRLNALWVGGDLSYIEQLCLISAIDVGHQVTLWTYEHVGGVPAGVDVGDAPDVMPRTMCVWNKKGKSFGAGADIFRILLQKQNRGCYIDCDLLLLKPIPDSEYILCEDGRQYVNNAILKLPPDCPIIDPIVELATAEVIVLPWWSWSRRVRQRLKGYVGLHKRIDELPWIALSGMAITYYLEVYGLRGKALSYEAYYPIPSKRVAEFFTPSAALHGITDQTIAVHLWNNKIPTALKNAPPPPGSFIHQHCVRLGIATETERLYA